MKKYQVLLAASFGLLLSACASNMVENKEVAQEEIASDDQIICVRQAVTGSNLKRKRCTTKRKQELEKEAAQDILDVPIYQNLK